MRIRNYSRCLAAAATMVGAAVLLIAAPPQAATQAPTREPDVIFVPTPQEVVDEMLKVAKVTSRDVLYDLGCGDGRIVITAVKKYGAKATGIDINPERIKEATENARKEGVGDRARFIQADLFTADIHDATVVTLYLLTSLNIKLKPRLWSELKPGTRIVSHAFDMGDWKPEKELDVNGRRVYMWTVPPKSGQTAAHH